MWNPFKKRSSNHPAPPANRVDGLANRLHREGRIEELELALEELRELDLSVVEKESWWHTYGIIAYQSGRNDVATSRFEQAYQLFPKSSHIKFSLGQQYVISGQLDRGFELFRSTVFPAVPREYILMQVRYAYLWNRYDDGLAMLRPFYEAYKEVKILDDHFLYVRGLPFFGTWWSYLASLSILSGDTRELESVTEYVCKNCHDYDFDYLNVELISYRDDKPEILLPFIEKRIKEAHISFPKGYVQMKLAVIQSRLLPERNAAEDLLEQVEIKENDFPWLEDLRTLAKAEIAHRHSHSEIEKNRINEFLTKQSMLFEPNIAVDFHLLRYQETLKPRYQKKYG